MKKVKGISAYSLILFLLLSGCGENNQAVTLAL